MSSDSKDQRKTYFLRVASYLLGLNIVEEKLKSTEPLEIFLDSNTNLLVFSRSEQVTFELSLFVCRFLSVFISNDVILTKFLAFLKTDLIFEEIKKILPVNISWFNSIYTWNIIQINSRKLWKNQFSLK